jgi:hypothetical protein
MKGTNHAQSTNNMRIFTLLDDVISDHAVVHYMWSLHLANLVARYHSIREILLAC